VIAALHSNSHPERNAGIATFFTILTHDARMGYMEFPTKSLQRFTSQVYNSTLLCLCEPTQVHEPLKEFDKAADYARFTIKVSHPDQRKPQYFRFTLIRNTDPANPRHWLLSRIYNTS